MIVTDTKSIKPSYYLLTDKRIKIIEYVKTIKTIYYTNVLLLQYL